MTLRETLAELSKNGTYKGGSPFMVWLLENPKSPLALPGAISLEQHDYVHCLLGKDLKLSSEAFVIGFTMGCDPKANWLNVFLFKIFSCYFYPRQYRFSVQKHWILFKRGFDLAQATHIRQLEKFNFNDWLDKPVEQLRRAFFGEKAEMLFS